MARRSRPARLPSRNAQRLAVSSARLSELRFFIRGRGILPSLGQPDCRAAPEGSSRATLCSGEPDPAPQRDGHDHLQARLYAFGGLQPSGSNCLDELVVVAFV
jgi:hypothetical protein